MTTQKPHLNPEHTPTNPGSKTPPWALVTGGNGGLGHALVTTLLAAGWQVLTTTRSEQAATDVHTRTAGMAVRTDQLHIVHLDLTEPNPAAAVQQFLTEEQVTLSAVVAAAATLVTKAPNTPEDAEATLVPLASVPAAQLADTLVLNTVRQHEILQTVLPFTHPGARLVTVTSDAGVNSYPTWGVYGASKAALEHLTATYAAEHPDRLWNWVDPGDMRTAMHQAAFPGEDIADRPLPDASAKALYELLQSTAPSGRIELAN